MLKETTVTMLFSNTDYQNKYNELFVSSKRIFLETREDGTYASNDMANWIFLGEVHFS